MISLLVNQVRATDHAYYFFLGASSVFIVIMLFKYVVLPVFLDVNNEVNEKVNYKRLQHEKEQHEKKLENIWYIIGINVGGKIFYQKIKGAKASDIILKKLEDKYYKDGRYTYTSSFRFVYNDDHWKSLEQDHIKLTEF